MKHSQNQVALGLGLEFAPLDGRIAVIENSVLATTRRVLGSNAHEQLKQHLRLVRQQRLEAKEMNKTDKPVTISQEDIRYYQAKARELRAQAIGDFFAGLVKWFKKVFFAEKTPIAPIAKVNPDRPSGNQIRADIARGEQLRAETVANAISKIGKRIGHLFKTATTKLGNNDSNVSVTIRDGEIHRHIEHAAQLRAVFMADAIFAAFNSITGAFAKEFKKVQQWHRQRVSWRELQSLSDYVLRDIGISREQLKHFSKELAGPEETWIDQVRVNQEATPASEVVRVNKTLTPEHAANDEHRELAA